MCGIAGFQGTFEPELLTLMGRAIAHRGPDSWGEWRSASCRVGLAHRRLSIIDVSPLGHQPMADPSGQTVIVFNGEIYNFGELRCQLEDKGHSFRGHSDTEVLVALYREHGEAMLPFLNGIFAFAIYDNANESLFLACDEMAVKPIYFRDGADGFVFASELKAMLCDPALSRSLDVTSLFRTLGFLWSPDGMTPLKGVCRVGPGEALRVKAGRVVRRWTWAASTWPAATPALADAPGVERVGEAFRTAVHRQMVSDVPVGAFLSGGLDSSAVVAMAREVAPRIECFTIDTGGTRDAGVADDLPYARRVAGHLGVKLHEVRVDSSRMAADLERMVFQLDEPLADPAPLNVLYISELARQHGVKVLLSGAGGDDLFSGYRRHRALILERYWSWLPVPARSALRGATAYLGQRRASSRRMTKSFAHADLDAARRLTGYFQWADTARIRGLFTADHQAMLAGEQMDAPLLKHLATLPTRLSSLEEMLALEQRFFLTDHNLLYTDKMSMAAGVEVRVPFLDRDLLRVANALPERFKQRGRQGKWVLKKMMEPILPRDVIYRAKTGFGAPVRQWLRHELKELVDDTLSAATLRSRGLFDPSAVSRLVEDDRAGRVDAAYTILGLMCIEIWCRQFLDGRQAHSAARADCQARVTA